jgi:hypothetical protein
MGGTNDNRKSGAEAAEKMTEAEVKRVTLIKRQRTTRETMERKKVETKRIDSFFASTEAKEK